MGALTGVVREDSIFIEADDRDLMNLANMPLVNIRLAEGQYELLTLPNGYYASIRYEIDVVAFDLSEYRVAARQRDDIVKACMLLCRGSTNFGSGIVDSSIIGEIVSYAAGTPEQGGGHIATATFRVVAKCYVDP